MGDIGLQEIMVVVIVAILVYGGRLPEAIRNVGQQYGRFKKKMQDIRSDIEREIQNSGIHEAKQDVEQSMRDATYEVSNLSPSPETSSPASAPLAGSAPANALREVNSSAPTSIPEHQPPNGQNKAEEPKPLSRPPTPSEQH